MSLVVIWCLSVLSLYLCGCFVSLSGSFKSLCVSFVFLSGRLCLSDHFSTCFSSHFASSDWHSPWNRACSLLFSKPSMAPIRQSSVKKIFLPCFYSWTHGCIISFAALGLAKAERLYKEMLVTGIYHMRGWGWWESYTATHTPAQRKESGCHGVSFNNTTTDLPRYWWRLLLLMCPTHAEQLTT